MDVNLLEPFQTSERDEEEHKHVYHFLPPSREAGSEDHFLDMEKVIMPQREHDSKSLDVRWHGLKRKGETRQRESKHAVECAYTKCKSRNGQQFEDEYSRGLT